MSRVTSEKWTFVPSKIFSPTIKKIQLNNILVQYDLMYVTDGHVMVQAIICWRLTE